MDRMTPDANQPATVSATVGLQLTLEETRVLNAVWSHAERVDWAVYERLRLRVLAWRSPGSPVRITQA